jgi:rhodanese-related sulfurtransferase
LQARTEVDDSFFNYIIDVREPEEYHKEGTIPGSTHIPLGKVFTLLTLTKTQGDFAETCTQMKSNQ